MIIKNRLEVKKVLNRKESLKYINKCSRTLTRLVKSGIIRTKVTISGKYDYDDRDLSLYLLKKGGKKDEVILITDLTDIHKGIDATTKINLFLENNRVMINKLLHISSKYRDIKRLEMYRHIDKINTKLVVFEIDNWKSSQELQQLSEYAVNQGKQVMFIKEYELKPYTRKEER